MASLITADALTPTVDSDAITVDVGEAFPIGWPCGLLSSAPPSVADLEAAPTADDLLPQILALAPRGPAWGTDEAGDGQGASPLQRRFWRAIAAFVADHLGLDFTAASQTFPSALTYTLPDWEAELGLPDPCGAPTSITGRVFAVRARFGALGGASPAYFVCLAESAGYTVTVEEPTQFLCDVSAVVGPDLLEGYFIPDDGSLDGTDLAEGYFRPDDGVCDADPLETFTLGAAGDGDPLETFTLDEPDDTDDEVAGLGPFESAFVCDDGVCDGDPLEGFDLDDPNGSVWKTWIVHLASGGDTAFVCDDGECDTDPLDGFVDAPALECLMRSQTPTHTQVVFAYDA